jgi:hypothetical protein
LSVLDKDELWKLLIEAVHALPMYRSHKRYVEDYIIKETPQITPQELSVQLNIPMGEAIVLLDEINSSKQDQLGSGSTESQRSSADRTLLDFSK